MKRRLGKIILLAGLLLLVPLGVLLASGKLRLSCCGHGEGIFALRGVDGAWLELKDDVFLGEEGRVLAGWSFDRSQIFSADPLDPEVFLEYRWNEVDGYGYVVNHLGGGRLLQTNFARYIDSDNRLTRGLFVGGGRPEALRMESPWRGSDTGMAYFDGSSWSHIWCNTNEVIGFGGNTFAPSSWQYLGSHVERLDQQQQLVVVSRHGVNFRNMPLEIERRAVFVAGQPFFDLTISLRNLGGLPANYFYFYGDEPWVGRYGGSVGDVGWVAGRLVNYEEKIDPRRHSFAGMADFGNPAIGEGRQGPTANFLEWRGPNLPDQVFFANFYQGFNHPPSTLVPLSGDGRSIGMYWGPKQILAGESQSMRLSIGMAEVDSTSGLPQKPEAKPAGSLNTSSRSPVQAKSS